MKSLFASFGGAPDQLVFSSGPFMVSDYFLEFRLGVQGRKIGRRRVWKAAYSFGTSATLNCPGNTSRRAPDFL